MSAELKVVAWMKSDGTHMPRMRMLNETYVQGVWDFALVRLSDAQSALQAKEAEIAALKEDAERTAFTEEQRIDLFAAALYISARGDETSVLSSENAERIAEFLCDLSGIDLDFTAAIDPARAAGDGEGKR